MFKRLFGRKKAEERQQASEQADDSGSNSRESSNEWPLLETVIEVFDVVRLIAEDAETMYGGEIREFAWEGLEDDTGIKAHIESLIPPEYDQEIEAYYYASEPDEEDLKESLQKIKSNTTDAQFDEIISSLSHCICEYADSLDMWGMLDWELGNDITCFDWTNEIYIEVLGEDRGDGANIEGLEMEERKLVFNGIVSRYSKIVLGVASILGNLNQPLLSEAQERLNEFSDWLLESMDKSMSVNSRTLR